MTNHKKHGGKKQVSVEFDEMVDLFGVSEDGIDQWSIQNAQNICKKDTKLKDLSSQDCTDNVLIIARKAIRNMVHDIYDDKYTIKEDQEHEGKDYPMFVFERKDNKDIDFGSIKEKYHDFRKGKWESRNDMWERYFENEKNK